MSYGSGVCRSAILADTNESPCTPLCVSAPLERHDGVTIIRAEAHAVLDAVRDDAWDAIVALEREHGQRLYGYALRLGRRRRPGRPTSCRRRCCASGAS